MGRELEFKYKASPEIQAKLAADFAPFRQIEMQTTYFDTADHALSARHATLRLRQENDMCICTLKTPLPDGSRGEWECEAATIQEGIAKLPQAAALVTGPVAPVCGAAFTRLAALVPTADGTAELALDRGILSGGGRELPLCEVEIEYKSGSDAAARALAVTIAQKYGLMPEKKSKFARAMALAEK